MADHPIIFDAESVRSILSGRKTQTRRVIKPQPPCGCEYLINGWGDHALCFAEGTEGTLNPICVPPTANSKDHRLRIPYAVGDRLWVRETWAGGEDFSTDIGTFREPVVYKASWDASRWAPWRSPIHMPRWASRITLEVTAVRVERLQSISERDAKAEGVEAANEGDRGWYGPGYSYRAGLRWVWDRIIAKRPGRSWRDNPWVFAYSFKVVEAKRHG